MAMVILGLAASGVLLPFVTAAQVQREATCQVLAAVLASNLMEQIYSTPFEQIDSDWDGYTEPEGQVKKAAFSNDNEMYSDPVYRGFARSVSCRTQQMGDVEGRLVTVNIAYQGRNIMQIQFLIGPK